MSVRRCLFPGHKHGAIFFLVLKQCLTLMSFFRLLQPAKILQPQEWESPSVWRGKRNWSRCLFWLIVWNKKIVCFSDKKWKFNSCFCMKFEWSHAKCYNHHWLAWTILSLYSTNFEKQTFSENYKQDRKWFVNECNFHELQVASTAMLIATQQSVAVAQQSVTWRPYVDLNCKPCFTSAPLRYHQHFGQLLQVWSDKL